MVSTYTQLVATLLHTVRFTDSSTFNGALCENEVLFVIVLMVYTLNA